MLSYSGSLMISIPKSIAYRSTFIINSYFINIFQKKMY
jgi:hypothetical protein